MSGGRGSIARNVLRSRADFRVARAGVRPRDYATFVAAFECTLVETLGPRWTPDLAEEWSRAMEIAAATMLEGDPDGGGPVHRDDSRRGPVTVERALREKLGASTST